MSISINKFLNKCLHIGQGLLQAECLLCGSAVQHENLCPACLEHLPYRKAPCCKVCAVPLSQGEICGSCLSTPPAFDRTYAAFSYGFPVDALIQSLKYQGNFALIPVLARALSQLVSNAPRTDYLIPVPLSAARLRERGFNQALEIAKLVARANHVPLSAHGCSRVLDTGPQTALAWKERAKNIRGAFVCEMDLRGKKVALLDDVMTTGATLNELAKTVRKQGAAEISAWVVARTPPH
ncbi:MAG: double zinc ribbon domain-containing protein [Burkholderiales bacterium]